MNNIEELREHCEEMIAISRMQYAYIPASSIITLIDRIVKAEKERDDLLNQEFQQRLANAEHQLYMKDLAIHNIKASRNAQFKKRKAAEKELAEWRSVAEAAAQDDADWHKLTDSKNEVIVNLALGVGLLIDCAEKAEAELSAANERIDELELQQIKQNDSNSVLSAALDAANEKLSKPVVLPEVVVVNISGKYPIEVMYASKVKTFIKAAGFTVEGE
ncbi:hypothetical protein ACVT81_004320 [Yersinia enterocolitica]